MKQNNQLKRKGEHKVDIISDVRNKVCDANSPKSQSSTRSPPTLPAGEKTLIDKYGIESGKAVHVVFVNTRRKGKYFRDEEFLNCVDCLESTLDDIYL
jgi:hypothetical protein